MPDAQLAYFRGEYRPIEDSNVNIRSKALNYGLGVFEGIRGYWNAEKKQLFLFRLREHYERLHKSARICRMPLALSVENLNEVTCELCRRNGHREDVYIRPLVFVDVDTLSPTLPESEAEVGVAIWTMPLTDYLEGDGVTACVTSWRRVGDNMIPARAKPTAAYLNSALARAEARDAGCDEGIFLTNDGYVSEGSAEHLFLVLDGKLVTSTTQDDNLDGITRRTVLQIASEDLGYETEVRRVSRTELYIASEAFFVGTGAQVTPVLEIDHRPINNSKPGPMTTAIKDLYFGVVRGDIERYTDWAYPVY